MLLELIRLLKKHDLKAQLVLDATLKHTPGVGWKVIGHCINRVVDFISLIDEGTWVEGWDPTLENGMGNPNDAASHARIRELFEGVKGPLADRVNIELHNEFDQHAKSAWDDSGFGYDQALAEVNLQLARFHKLDHWPRGSVGVSHGGQDDFEYDPHNCDSINIHPGDRPNLSWRNRFDHLRRHGKPIFLDEVCHHIANEFWWTIEKGWFGPKSSTRDHQGYYEFHMGNRGVGIWTCDHSLVNMSSGFWLNGTTWEEMPLDPFEKMLAGDTLPLPPPTPIFDPLAENRPAVRQAYLHQLGRDPWPGDVSGMENSNSKMKAGATYADILFELAMSKEAKDNLRR